MHILTWIFFIYQNNITHTATLKWINLIIINLIRPTLRWMKIISTFVWLMLKISLPVGLKDLV